MFLIVSSSWVSAHFSVDLPQWGSPRKFFTFTLSIGSMGCIGGADRTFACKSQECLWQDWYISIGHMTFVYLQRSIVDYDKASSWTDTPSCGLLNLPLSVHPSIRPFIRPCFLGEALTFQILQYHKSRWGTLELCIHWFFVVVFFVTHVNRWPQGIGISRCLLSWQCLPTFWTSTYFWHSPLAMNNDRPLIVWRSLSVSNLTLFTVFMSSQKVVMSSILRIVRTYCINP